MPTLDWIAKKAVLNHHRQVPFHLIDYREAQIVGDPSVKNLLIQGDNLLALKALLPYYAGKIRCIYIDPPYNTGKEAWVYNDNVNSPEIRKWLGQVVGKDLEDLSRHDKWLCMMYPRLSLLKELLADDGVIFISIGKDEVGNLRALCDEVLGERNHMDTFIWQIEGHIENQEDITTTNEFILAYSRRPDHPRINPIIDPNVEEGSKLLRDFAENSIVKNTPVNPASLVELPIGFPCAVDNLELGRHEFAERFMQQVEVDGGYIKRNLKSEFDTEYPVRLDDLIVEDGELISPCRVYSGWSSVRKLRRFIETGCVPFVDEDGSLLRFFLSNTGTPSYRRQDRNAHFVSTILRNMGTTEVASYELERMGVEFPYPKPVTLIEYLLSMYTRPGDIVLDSFAGSGTTGEAVLRLNRKNAGLSFILVELDSDIAKSVTFKRLKSNVEGYNAKRRSRTVPVQGLGGGFRSCTLGPQLLDAFGRIDSPVTFNELAAHIYFMEAGMPLSTATEGSLIGYHNDTAIYLLFDGVPGNGANVLTSARLRELSAHAGRKVIYADGCAVSQVRLQQANAEFRHIPYDIRMN